MPKITLHRHNIVWLILATLLIAFDQWTKWLSSTHLPFEVPQSVLPFLNFTLAHNYGAAFSFLADAGGWQRWFFTGFSLLACVIFLFWLLSLPKNQKVLALGLTGLLSGAVGNLIDRVQLGYVVDFIQVHWQHQWYFAIFNWADCCVSVGVALLIIDILWLEPKRQKSEQSL